MYSDFIFTTYSIFYNNQLKVKRLHEDLKEFRKQRKQDFKNNKESISIEDFISCYDEEEQMILKKDNNKYKNQNKKTNRIKSTIEDILMRYP